jgi:hypothetical protein
MDICEIRDASLHGEARVKAGHEANRTTYFFCESEFVSRPGEMKEVWFEER